MPPFSFEKHVDLRSAVFDIFLARLSRAAKNELFGFLPNFDRGPQFKVWGALFGSPGAVFTARGLEKRKKPKEMKSRAKLTSP